MPSIIHIILAEKLILNFKQYNPVAILLTLYCVVLLSLVLMSIAKEPIYIWDEAVYANNSLEMAQHNHYFIYTDNGIVDHYNTKPPLVLWLQALSFKLFSYSEFALRLPTLFALLGILFLFFRYTRKLQLAIGIFLLASFILLTTKGAMRNHVFLSGDLDGVLVFFTTALSFIHLQQLHEKKITNRSMILFFVCLLCGYFTKSTAILLILPSFFFSYLFAGLLGSILKNKMQYMGLAFCIVIVLIYYFIKEKYDKGYIEVVWYSEFKRYSNNVMFWHNQPFSFYIKNICGKLNPYYLALTACVTVPYFYIKTIQHKRLILHIFLLCVIYLLIISIPSVKLAWYDAPIYPLWSFALAIMIYEIYFIIYNKIKSNKLYLVLLSLGLNTLVLFLFSRIYIEQFAAKREYQPQEKEAALVKQIDHKYKQPAYTILMDVEENKLQHFDALNFYIKSFKLNHKKVVTLKRTISEVHIHDTLIVMQQEKIDSLEHMFITQKIESHNENYLLIVSKR